MRTPARLLRPLIGRKKLCSLSATMQSLCWVTAPSVTHRRQPIATPRRLPSTWLGTPHRRKCWECSDSKRAHRVQHSPGITCTRCRLLSKGPSAGRLWSLLGYVQAVSTQWNLIHAHIPPLNTCNQPLSSEIPLVRNSSARTCKCAPSSQTWLR